MFVYTFFVAATLAVSAQPDVATLGPQVGTAVPPFSGIDQSGRTQTLDTIMGPRGAMIVFYRSADW